MSHVSTHPLAAAAGLQIALSDDERTTPAPRSRRFRDALAGATGVLLGGVDAVGTAVPGVQLVSAAVHGAAGPQGGGAIPEVAAQGGGVESTLAGATDENLRYLVLQERISAESRRFSTLSNVMKARHDTAKATINNIR